MAKINKEIVNRLENDAQVAAWDKGEDEIDPDCKVVRCEDCRFRNQGYWLKQNEVYCNKSGLIMRHDDFCSYGVRYNIDDKQRKCACYRSKKPCA